MVKKAAALLATMLVTVLGTAGPAQADDPEVFHDIQVWGKTIYPYYDDWKDDTAVRVLLDPRSNYDVTYTVRHHNTGDVVYQETDADVYATYYDDYASTNFTWFGDDQETGRTVRDGTYQIEIAAYNQTTGLTYFAERFVTVASGVRWLSKSKRFRGIDSRDKQGNCRIAKGYRSYLLDCWAGGYAEVTVSGYLPRNAKKVGFRINGERMCCEPGTVTIQTWRPNKRTVKGKVRVTDWRAYQLDHLYVWWKEPQRI
jgi:hypothetical protein